MSRLQAALALARAAILLAQPSNLAVEVLDDGDKRPQQRRQCLVVQRLLDQDPEGRAG